MDYLLTPFFILKWALTHENRRKAQRIYSKLNKGKFAAKLTKVVSDSLTLKHS